MTMRFGLFGTGYWARETHARALAASPASEFVGVWGRSAERAAELADTFGIRSYSSVDGLLDDVDAVAIALPPAVQVELATRAAERGRHLLLDKPLALDTAAADRAVDAARRAGVRSVVFFTLAFMPEVRAWLDEMQREDDWQAGQVTTFASIFEPGNPYSQSRWRREKGALWDIGPHALSILLPVLGAVDRVVAARGRGDAVTVTLNHTSGAVSTMSLSLTAPSGAVTSEWHLYGSRFSTTMPPTRTTPVEALCECISALAADADRPSPHPFDIRFGREVVSVLQAAESYLTRDDSNRGESVR
jgi:predicted dehydrogenase